ncbi:MAG: ABC transporter permease, partial [Marmoricola sp.]|nr:ABC transporter permease [Marmoricola sp.]
MVTIEGVVPEAHTPPRRRLVRVSAGSRFPVLGYAVKRVLAGLLTLVIATFLIFASIQILPGNVAEVVLGRNATPERVAQLESQLHLSDSIWSRYVDYVHGFLTGDFGYSTAALVQGSHVKVADVVTTALANSLVLAGIVLVFFIPLSLLLGFVSGRRAGSAVDHVVSTSTLAVGALPEFLIGTLLIYVFFTQLGWFPPISSLAPGTSAMDNLNSLVLPVMTLLLVSLAFGSRLLRASIVDVLSKDYVAVARMNGVSEGRVNARYLLPNALVPSVQILAQQIQYLLGGIVVVESVFNYPGIGAELVRAISVRDVQEIMI